MPSPTPIPHTVQGAPSSETPRIEARGSGTALMVWLDRNSMAQLCVLPLQEWETAMPRQASVLLDGSVSAAKIKQTLRDIDWRIQRGNPCFVVIPSEDVLLLVEEFPATDPMEVRAMAEGLLQGMVELEPNDHTLSTHVLSHGPSTTLCVLAVFQRERIEKIFTNLQRLGITNPRFVIDLLADFLSSENSVQNGFWGCVVDEEARPLLAVKALKIIDGMIRGVRQQFYARQEIQEAWLNSVKDALFPEDSTAPSLPITWHSVQVSIDLPQRLSAFTRQVASGAMPSFELQPGFWKEHLKRQRLRRGWLAAGKALAATYVAFLLYLSGFSAWQWYAGNRLKAEFSRQEPPFREAMEMKQELAAVRASLNPAGSALEVLRQIAESMPEGLTLDSFSYRFQERVKIRGTATNSEAVYDFVGKLRTNPSFRDSKVDSVGENQGQGGVTWQVDVPLSHVANASP